MASEKRTQSEQLKQLLHEFPHEIISPVSCSETDAAKVQALSKYVYPVLKTGIEHTLRQILEKDAHFVAFGEALDELESLKQTGQKRTNTQDVEPGKIDFDDYKIIALHKQIRKMQKKIQANNTKINNLMNQVERKRERVNNVHTNLMQL
ncbi:uncharacterized protein [Atheta coriaria]|uniref:uncharacterized protein n=1 Tax=Dalotia coriaria TaxID=877792 RepID=UPI0031F4490A